MGAFEQHREILQRYPRTWLITGAAGFIGSNLVERLLLMDQNVVGLDNLSTGYNKNLNQVRDIVGQERASRFRFVEGDIRDIETCKTCSKGTDIVLHQAAFSSVPASVDDPLKAHGDNLTGFLNVLVAARDAGVSRFVYASSSAIYGDDPALPKSEDLMPKPLSPYAVTKLADELYASAFSGLYGIPTVGLRYFNVFGPRQDPNGAYAAVIPRWIMALTAGQRPLLYGNGEQTRDFCHVENVFRANILAAVSDNEQAFGNTFNVATGRHLSLRELFDLIRAGMEKRRSLLKGVEPKVEPSRKGDIVHSWASINGIAETLGYETAVPVDEGMEISLDWYLENLV